jgi:signal transduction histidine kinase
VDALAHEALQDSQKGVDTVMSILDNANVESGDLALVQKKFDLSETIRRAAQEFQSQAGRKGLTLASSINSPCMIKGDEQKIERHVVRNFLDNAIRYTPAGQIDVVLERVGGMARFSVADTGVGMSAADMQRLFTEGGHGEHSKEVNPESTGYGLYVAKQIVEKHGGKVWAHSSGPGTGSQFFAEFPIVVPVV